MKIGIDKIGFFAPQLYVDMVDLAKARGVDPDKFTIGIGQEKMAVAPQTQDSVTLAANAAKPILTTEDKQTIDLVIFATETGVDHSKSGAAYLHRLLGLKPGVRSFEVKQACYAATAGIQMAKGHISLHPESKVLVVASDIARYGLNTGGEVTQGAGAVAMVISSNPRILSFEEPSTLLTDDIMDFWRPAYSETAFVDGRYSNEQYLRFFTYIWEEHKAATRLSLKDYEALCFHVPYTKMGLKALRTVLDEGDEIAQERLIAHFEKSILYNKNIGNIYTGSLYLSLVSLLEQSKLTDGHRVGLFSYGSGAVGEFFSGVLQPGYEQQLHKSVHESLLETRQALSVEEYEAIFRKTIPTDGSDVEFDISSDPAPIVLAGMREHQRMYVAKKEVHAK